MYLEAIAPGKQKKNFFLKTLVTEQTLCQLFKCHNCNGVT